MKRDGQPCWPAPLEFLAAVKPAFAGLELDGGAPPSEGEEARARSHPPRTRARERDEEMTTIIDDRDRETSAPRVAELPAPTGDALDAAWALAWADRYLDRMTELGLLPEDEDTSALATHLATMIRELAADERERGRREASLGPRPVSGACGEDITNRDDEHRQMRVPPRARARGRPSRPAKSDELDDITEVRGHGGEVMTVADLIEKLKELGDGNHVVFEGQGKTCWTVRAVEVDESDLFVMLTRGEKLPVTEDI